MITAGIEAKKKRGVALIDIPNALIQTKQTDNEKVIIRLRGRMAENMCMIAPEIYQPYAQFESDNKVLCAKSVNGIYGTLKTALLFYKNLSKDTF